jgi:acetyltransferase-like isoleucine patch superfamily enzyme
VRIYSRESIRIGKRLVSSWNVFIQDFDPHPIDPDLRALQVHNICATFKPSYGKLEKKSLDFRFPTAPIELGDDIWIGANVTILKGVKVGSGSIIASNAVVTSGEYPARSILAGNPARVVKTV